ncbi:MAG TPA: hypothetical protein VH054_10030 [Polyangiaceae bacterium]|jgi:hypothetical protein|nr:hypothetical protein [Polyangiaceae bacterium]
MNRLALAPLLVVCLPTRAAADETPPPCNTWEVEYTLAAQVELSDTAMGAGDGVHAIGPGALVLHFDNVHGAPGGNAKLMTYDMTDQFTVNAKVVGIGTSVVNDTHTKTTPNICGVAAQGMLDGRVLRWGTLWNGIHTDGHLTCSGSMCGRMGAPPAGQSEVHTPAHPAVFKPFEYAPDLKTFHMDYSVTAKSTNPSQTSKITFNGRESKRSCIYVKPCP